MKATDNKELDQPKKSEVDGDPTTPTVTNAVPTDTEDKEKPYSKFSLFLTATYIIGFIVFWIVGLFELLIFIFIPSLGFLIPRTVMIILLCVPLSLLAIDSLLELIR